MKRSLQLVGALLKMGLAEAMAYRAEFIVWFLTSTMPLIMLALMTTVAREAPFGAMGADDFAAYYLVVLIIRQFTTVWVAWEMTEEIKSGTMSMRLLRPLHPILPHMVGHLASIPLRGMIVIPVAGALLIWIGPSAFVQSPAGLGVTLFSIIGAWFIAFGIQACVGCAAFFFQSAHILARLYFALFLVFSGYILPLQLFPPWLQTATYYLPFRYQLALPVDLALGRLALTDALPYFLAQWTWIAIVWIALSFMWRGGIRRYEAFGA